MKKKWFTERTCIDTETGEILSKSRIEREGWIKLKNREIRTENCGAYYLKKIIQHYEQNRQLRLFT